MKITGKPESDEGYSSVNLDGEDAANGPSLIPHDRLVVPAKKPTDQPLVSYDIDR